MKLMIVGAQGQLGRYLKSLLEGRYDLIAPGRGELDITQEEQVKEALQTHAPDILINCSAYNKVDLAEEESEEAMRVNCAGVGFLARHLAKSSHFLHLSTDYVFDGKKKTPYLETDEALPLSAYGRSKKAGEDIALAERERVSVLRTAWLYSEREGNFLHAIVRKMKEGLPLRVVDDQIGTPTSVKDLGMQIEKIIEHSAFGLFHASAEGECSWYEYASRIAALMGEKADIQPITTEQLREENSSVKARRPAYSVLENGRLKQLGFNCMKSWEDSLEELIKSRIWKNNFR